MARKSKKKAPLDVQTMESELAKAHKKIRELQEEVRILRSRLSDTERSSGTSNDLDYYDGSAFFKMT